MTGFLPLTESTTWILLFLLRHALFLGPLLACVVLMWRARKDERAVVGAIFSFLYGLPVVFFCHVLAIHMGAWTYGGETLKVMGFPADTWFGGVLMWGPVCFLINPAARQWLAPVAFVLINGLMLPHLAPFVAAGHNWFFSVVVVFFTAHLPALYLAQWTCRDEHLPLRAFLLAAGFAPFAFFLIPTLIMQTMGGGWEPLFARSPPILFLVFCALAVVAIIGWSGVQMFCLYGDGTPIPLDPTKRLVTSGVYAYVSNPMQMSTALGFAVLGLALGNVWVSAGAVMSVIFVLGMVRWHHRHDLAVRFPAGWPQYRANVREWFPAWRPWRIETATLAIDDASPWQRAAWAALSWLKPVGLQRVDATGPLIYQDARRFEGLAAFAQALNLCNFASMLVGSGLLLMILPLRYLAAVAARLNATTRAGA